MGGQDGKDWIFHTFRYQEIPDLRFHVLESLLKAHLAVSHDKGYRDERREGGPVDAIGKLVISIGIQLTSTQRSHPPQTCRPP